mgnify:CR=1 FL=1
MRDHIFDHFREFPVGYGSTYFAHPMCCAVAYATIQYILENNIVAHVKSVEPVMKAGLERLVEKHPSVKSARTNGLGGGFDLAGKDGNFLMYMHEAHEGVGRFKQELLNNGLVTLIRGHHVHCTPPLIISEDEVCRFACRVRVVVLLLSCVADFARNITAFACIIANSLQINEGIDILDKSLDVLDQQ